MKDNPMTEFTPGQTADIANNAIKSSLETMAAARKCSLLWFGEILERKLFKKLGFSSINQYAEVELGFSSSRTGLYLKLCRELERFPQVKGKVVSGELGYTKAEAILPVLDPSNESHWLDFAGNHTRLEIVDVVKQAKSFAIVESANKTARQPSLIPNSPSGANNPNSPNSATAPNNAPLPNNIPTPNKFPKAIFPVSINMKMSPIQFARYEGAWEQIRKNRKLPADKVEALLEILESFATDDTSENSTQSSRQREQTTSTRPPVQIHIHKCSECSSATVQTSKGEFEIGELALEQALCDCNTSNPGQRNTSSIPPKTRREILTRARHQCQRKGCHHTRFLEVHHIIPRAKGGTNHLSNLTCLCSACHKLLHENKSAGMAILVKEISPGYQWRKYWE